MNQCLSIITIVASLFAVTAPAADFDVVVSDRAVVQRCVTSGDARNIAVGMPGGFNYLFDPVRCRLAHVWFGEFLDYRNESTGRGGRTVQILGTKQSVGTDPLPLRIGDYDRKPATIQFDGYRKEQATGIPTFLFRVDGVPVEQRVMSFGPNQVTIELSFPGSDSSTRYYRTDPKSVESVETSARLRLASGNVIAIPAEETWAQIRLILKPSEGNFVRKEPTTNGRLLYALHCMSCHTLDGKKKIGPSFADLWTSSRIVARGQRTVTIDTDEHYIRESILQPQAAIVQGYENANKMIDIRKTLNEKQIDALVEFLVGLKTPD